MKSVFLAFAFLAAALAAPAAAAEDPYEIEFYEGAPGPLIYSAGEEPEWLPRVLKKLEKPRKPRKLKERLVFRDANGPTHLVTTWGTGIFPEFLEIHRIEVRDGKGPAATFVYGLQAGYIISLVPTGQDVFGDGVPALFIGVGNGGSAILHDGVRIIRLEREPKDVTPKQYGNVKNVGLMPGDDKRLFLVATDIPNSFYRQICGTCYVMPETFLVWRDGGYVPACRDVPDYYRPGMEYLRSEYDLNTGVPEDFIGTRLGWAFDAAQIGQVDAAIREVESAVAVLRRRGPDWPGWTNYHRGKPEEYGALISNMEGQFLPLLKKARRFSEAACPLTAAQGPIAGSKLDVRPIRRTPLHDVK